MVREMQGQVCIAFEDAPRPRTKMAHTRSFGNQITELANLVESVESVRSVKSVKSVTEFASRACENLRRQNGHAGQVLVLIHTSAFRTNDPQYSRSVTVPLREPMAESGLVALSAVRGLRAIYRPGFRYTKAGVLLLNLAMPRLSNANSVGTIHASHSLLRGFFSNRDNRSVIIPVSNFRLHSKWLPPIFK